jgi:hypothetical protein
VVEEGAGVQGAEEVEEEVEEAVAAGTGTAELLPRRDSLYPERVAARPSDLVLHFAVRADGFPCNLLSEPGRSNYSHSSLAISTAEDFLHTPS